MMDSKRSCRHLPRSPIPERRPLSSKADAVKLAVEPPSHVALMAGAPPPGDRPAMPSGRCERQESSGRRPGQRRSQLILARDHIVRIQHSAVMPAPRSAAGLTTPPASADPALHLQAESQSGQAGWEVGVWERTHMPAPPHTTPADLRPPHASCSAQPPECEGRAIQLARPCSNTRRQERRQAGAGRWWGGGAAPWWKPCTRPAVTRQTPTGPIGDLGFEGTERQQRAGCPSDSLYAHLCGNF